MSSFKIGGANSKRELMEAIELNDRGVIGDTVRGICKMYHLARQQNDTKWDELSDPISKMFLTKYRQDGNWDGLFDPKTPEELTEGLNNFFKIVIHTRYSSESVLPDPVIEKKMLELDHTEFGAFDFLINLFKTEFDPSELSKISLGTLIDVIQINFEKFEVSSGFAMGANFKNFEIEDLQLKHL